MKSKRPSERDAHNSGFINEGNIQTILKKILTFLNYDNTKSIGVASPLEPTPVWDQ